VASSDGNLYLYSFSANGIPVTPVETVTPAPTQTAAPDAEGVFSFSSAPTGADVYIDNAIQGITPVTLPMKAGQYRIMMRLNGYNDWTTTVNLTPGDTTHVAAQMNLATPVSTPIPLGCLPVLAGLVFAAVFLLRRSDE
jgi:hypothetical protein